MTEYIVHAVEPTLLAGREHYQLRDTDLWLPFPVDTAIIVPGTVDAARLKDALSRALSIFPLYAGRVEKRGSQWLIRVSNEGAVFEVIDSEAQDPPVPPNSPVILAPFALAKRIDHWSLYSGSSTEPLLRLSLVRGPRARWSAVVFNMSHVIGDGEGVRAFMRTLSRLYENSAPLLEDVPCYDYPPNEEVDATALARAEQPWLARLVPLPSATPKPDAPPLAGTLRVDFRLNAPQLVQLRAGVLARAPTASELERLSKQDCIVSAVALAVTQTCENNGLSPITRVNTIFNYRGVGAVARTAACNALIQAVADLPPSSSTKSPSFAYGLAQVVRRSLLQSRDYAAARACIALVGIQLSAVANSTPPLNVDIAPAPGSLTVNSSRPFDWTAAHFGFPGRASFYHTMTTKPRFVKIFTPNPTLLQDGTWRENRGAAEVVLYVERELREEFVRSLRQVVAPLGVLGDIELVDS